MTKKCTIILGTLLVVVSAIVFVGINKLMTGRAMSDTATSVIEKPKDLKLATFAGGCFWCMESAFQDVKGVYAVTSGLTGGDSPNPTYKEVSSGKTNHVEAVLVEYNPEEVSFEELLTIFWYQIDPTDPAGQFADRGYQYTTAIFYHDDDQKEAAEKSKVQLDASKKFEKPIVTRVVPAAEFFEAEEYHQDYYIKNPLRYKFYRRGSGRDAFIESTWGKEASQHGNQKTYDIPSDAELREQLTDLQYKVTQKDGTEKPFDNEYWDNKAEGIYVDIVSGEPLFSSIHKYKSGTGWPSFYEMLEPENVVLKKDYKLILPRTEVRSKHADSHIGHVFKDGPEPTGLRYCLNSAALRFVPKEDLEAQGYAEYTKLFETSKG